MGKNKFDLESMSSQRQDELRRQILNSLTEVQRREVAHMPLSFIAYLHPGITEFGPRYPLWQAGMDRIEEILNSWDNPGLSVDLRDTYYLYTVSTGELHKSNLRNGRGNNILDKFPPYHPRNSVEERVQRTAGMADGDPKVACIALGLFSTFLLAEDFIERITPYSDEKRWDDAMYEHHEFCLRNGIEY